MNKILKTIIKVGLFGFGILSLLTALMTLIMGFSQLALFYFIIAIACFSPSLWDWNKTRQTPEYKEKKRRERTERKRLEGFRKESYAREKGRIQARKRSGHYNRSYDRSRHHRDDYIGPGILTELAQDEIPKGGINRALGIRKDGSVRDFGTDVFYRKKKKRRK